MGNGERCEEIEDIYHCLSQCEIVEECFEELKQVIQVLLERDVTNKEILCYGYNHRNKKRLRLVTWAATKVLFRIYMEKKFNKRQIWIELVKEIEWNLNREYKMGGKETYLIGEFVNLGKGSLLGESSDLFRL